MHPYAWPLDAEALAVPLLAVAYLASSARRGRGAAFAASQLLLLGVFATPVHTIAVRYLVFAHFLQNVVVAEWAPALAVLGLSAASARRFEKTLGVRALTHPLVALPLWLGTYFIWHVPRIYDAALGLQLLFPVALVDERDMLCLVRVLDDGKVKVEQFIERTHGFLKGQETFQRSEFRAALQSLDQTGANARQGDIGVDLIEADGDMAPADAPAPRHVMGVILPR